MKTVLSAVLVLVLALGVVSLVACGGEAESPAPTPTPAATPTPPPAATPTPGAPSGFTWNDMPVYSGAKQLQQVNWALPPADDEDYSRVEWRYYETSDGKNAVVSFYKTQMPGKGWHEEMWMDMGDMSMGYYSMNDEEHAAWVWIMAEGGKTSFALMRAAQ